MRVAILSLHDPVGFNSGGAMRIRSMSDALETCGAEVIHVFPAAPSGSGVAGGADALPASRGERELPGFVRDLKRYFLPMPLAAGSTNPAITERLKELDADIHILNAPSQRGLLPDTKAAVWVDFMDLWSDMAAREANIRRGPARFTTNRQAEQLRGVEAALVKRAAAVTTAGYLDWQSIGPAARWLPTPVISTLRQRPSRPHTKTAGFIANFNFWPNLDAYERIVRDWLPLLKAQGWQVKIAGTSSDTLPAVDGIEVLGRVAELDDFYDQIDVTLAPIGLGGGMKVKVVESLAYGIPVLSSHHGLEGTGLKEMQGVRIVDLARPDFSELESFADQTPESTALSPFTYDFFTQQVRDVLSDLVA